jgi:hypothetical protein
MLSRTKDIGAGGFRARPADAALAATGGASPSPRWDVLLGRIGGRRAPQPSIKVRQQLPGGARYIVVVGRPAVRAPRRARHCPKAIRVHCACRRPGTTPSQRDPRGGWRLPRPHRRRGRGRSAARRRQPGRRRQAQVERASVEHRERVLGVVGGHLGVAHACRRRARLASAGQVSSWNTVSRPPVAQQLGVGAAVAPRRRRAR